MSRMERQMLHRILTLIFVLCTIPNTPLHAQPFTRGQFGSLPAIQARAAQLNPPDKDLPEIEQFMYDEVRRIDDELRELRGISVHETEKREKGQLDSIKGELATAIQGISSLDCKKPNAQTLRSLIVPFEKIQSYVSRTFFNEEIEAPQPNPFSMAFWFGPDRPKFDSAFCNDLKAYIGDNANQQLFPAYIDKLVANLGGEQKKLEEYTKAASGLADLLQKRRAAIQLKLASRVTQQQIGNSLWLVILIIEVASFV